MIKEVKMYTVVCDGCGKDSNENAQYSCWSDEIYAKDVAMEANWISEGENHYCTDCYHYDDEDNLILKKKEDGE